MCRLCSIVLETASRHRTTSSAAGPDHEWQLGMAPKMVSVKMQDFGTRPVADAPLIDRYRGQSAMASSSSTRGSRRRGTRCTACRRHVGDRGASPRLRQREFRKHFRRSRCSPSTDAGRSWRAGVAHLHDDHHAGLRDQRPAARGKPEPLDASRSCRTGARSCRARRRRASDAHRWLYVDGDNASRWRLQERQPARSG